MTMSTSEAEFGAQYRLRFLLQEFNLAPGITLIGRGADCHITIFDPSVSRQHARIVVEGGKVVLEDLSSRNGCRVNGVRIRGPIELQEGDRIRIGTQELVFGSAYENSHVQHRQTGSLCYCADCRAAYANEMGACPSCGSTARRISSPADLIEDETTAPPVRRHNSVPPRR